MQLLFTALLLVQMATLQASRRQKRLVFDEVDIPEQLAILREEVAVLNITYRTDIEHLKNAQQAELQNLNNTYKLEIENVKGVHKTEIAALNDTIGHLKSSHEAEMSNVVSQLASFQKEHGSTYVRWGNTHCGGGNGTQLIYKGYMAGSEYTQTGNGANPLCLPEDPTWGKYDDGNQAGDRGYIYGTEYEEESSYPFGKHVKDEDVPCAVCHVPGTSLMIPARTTCYPGWSLEYTGYLMSGYHGQTGQTNYVCVDGDPELVTRGSGNTNGHLLYLVEGMCGTLVCPPYVNNRELACSVCSKVHE